jgi:hypothetical protein
MKEERFPGECKGTLIHITYIFQISLFNFIYMIQFGRNLSKYNFIAMNVVGAVHSEWVEECCCAASGIFNKEKRFNLSLILVTIVAFFV